MRRDITISVAREADTKRETTKLSLHFPGQAGEVMLDIDGASLLKVSRAVPDLAQDFLCISACIYAADKALARTAEDDKWTRHLRIEIPVAHITTWTGVADDLSECVGFLTGDRWEISFRHEEKRLIQKKPRKRRVVDKRPSGKAVCLFSGGLDSFIGAVDWLTENPGDQLLLVGHYDRDVAGPGSDQRRLRDACRQHFPNRFELAQTQVGLSVGGVDINFRSRSLLFIALACYFAEILGESIPVLIPENGPIAINFPLIPSRRGSCSTRTVHPQFLASLNEILGQVGIRNPVTNPYALRTKGEMVDECRDLTFLTAASALTRSCAKSNRRGHWINKKGVLGCGICIPCLLRRSALHKCGLDRELYGIPIESVTDFRGVAKADLLALVAFLRRNPSDREIAAELLANGTLRLSEISSYIDLIKRMRVEMLAWLRAKGSAYLRNEVRAC
jgi:hypothetical protein